MTYRTRKSVVTLDPNDLDTALARDNMTTEARAAAETELTVLAGATNPDR